MKSNTTKWMQEAAYDKFLAAAGSSIRIWKEMITYALHPAMETNGSIFGRE
jgi:hypothetical protein